MNGGIAGTLFNILDKRVPILQERNHFREVSKMSQVRILASPPPIGASKPDGALVSKTPANANKSYRNVEPSSCQPNILGQTKMKNRIHSSVRDRGQGRGSVQSEGSGKSRLSLMSRKIKLFSDDRKPKNSRDTRYSPLVNQVSFGTFHEIRQGVTKKKLIVVPSLTVFL